MGAGRIRVLVVDDEVVVRAMVMHALASEPDLEVCGSAADGRLALARVAELAPDVVLLDLDMPDMDGLACLEALRTRAPRVGVVVFTGAVVTGGEAALRALALGAVDVLPKLGTGRMADALRGVVSEVAPRVRLAARCPIGSVRPASPPTAPPHRVVAPVSPGPLAVLAVASSTGGPQALEAFLGALPPDFPAPILLVQHMPVLFTAYLAERLTRVSPFTVREAVTGAVPRAGEAWVAPGDWHLEVRGTPGALALQLHQGPAEQSCRPSADVLFRSVAAVAGRRAIAVVLTGMGQDGLAGARELHRAGGTVMAQDEASSVVWGMPGAVVRAGLAGTVLPPPALAEAVARHAGMAVTPA